MEIRNIYKRINHIRFQLNEKNKIIADYILKNFDNIDNLTLKKIQKETKQSLSTITRFCQKVGCSGFLELRKLIINSHKSVQLNNYEIVFPKKNITNPIEFVQKYNEIIDNSNTSINEMIENKTFDRVAQHIINAKKVFIAGININYNQSLDFHNKLVAIGINSFLTSDHYVLETYSNIASQDDVFITVSLSNQNEEIYNFGKLAQENGAKWIKIFSYPKNSKKPENNSLIDIFFESAENKLWNIYSLRGGILFKIYNILLFYIINKITNN